MAFWRTWTAPLLGASGAALLVPVALLLTVGAAAGISGTGGLGGLGQLTAGPSLPGTERPSARPVVALDGGLPAVPRLRRAATSVRRVSPATATSQTARPARVRRPAPRVLSSPPGVTGTASQPASGSPAARPAAPPTPTTPAASTAPAPASSTAPAAVPPGVQAVQGVVGSVPVAGPAVADAVGSVAGLILPPPPASSAP